MADNINDETLDNPINFKSADPSNEIIPVTEKDTITPNQETENMEVHKHPHHATHTKKWGEYLLEFIMLFLAVFLGFIAENIREHVVENDRVKEYAISLVQDLQNEIGRAHV